MKQPAPPTLFSGYTRLWSVSLFLATFLFATPVLRADTSPPPCDCHYTINISLNGDNLQAWLGSGAIAPVPPDTVHWTLNGQPAGNGGPQLAWLLPEYGKYLLCATYTLPDGATCTSCRAFRYEPLCIDSSLIYPVPCATVVDPVCGCDGKTYGNSCEALNWSGVASWHDGPCQATDVCNSLSIDFTGFNSGGSTTYWTFNGAATFPGATDITWAWNFGGLATSTEQNPAFNFPAPGEYRVSLRVDAKAANGKACSATLVRNIRVAQPDCYDPARIDPTVGCFEIYDPVCGCDGNTYANACYAEYYYGITDWTPGTCPDNCVDSVWTNELISCNTIYDPVCGCDGKTYQNDCIALYQNGITAWTKGECCQSPVCEALFAVEILPNRTVRLSDNSTNAESWSLDFGDGTLHGGYFDSLLHTYAAPGAYTICLTISNFGGDCTDTYCVDVDFSSTAAGSPSQAFSVLLAPNPARDRVRLQLEGATLFGWTLSDLLGRPVRQSNPIQPERDIMLTGIPAGVYALRLDTDAGTTVRMLAIER